MTVVIAGALGAAGLATALLSDNNFGRQTISGEDLERVFVYDSHLERGSIERASIHDSTLNDFQVTDATLRRSYVDGASLNRVLVEESRLEGVDLRDATLRDVTLCDGVCRLTSGGIGRSAQEADFEVHAVLHEDAPEEVAPGATFDLRVSGAHADGLTVHNDPPGTSAFGFDDAAADANVRLELLDHGQDGNDDGEDAKTFALGETQALSSGDFTLRVHVAETGIVDGSHLGLVLDLDGHRLRPAVTMLQVVATQLSFAPPEGQAFAPFLADNVARLVISLPTDEDGNVDRDLDIAYTLNVVDVDATGGHVLTGDEDQHAFLHGDSELFSDTPIKYTNPTSQAAHRPATLEFILRDTVGLEGITYGTAGFYATHLVAQSPFATTVEVTASTENADGEGLEAGPVTLELGPLPEEPRSASTPFGPLGDPQFPGEGLLRVRFVDSDGHAVEAGDDWHLTVQETPESHQTMMRLSLADAGETFEVPLAASEPVGLPFGDFVPHEYVVCVEQGDRTDCARDGQLVPISNGGTTDVSIVVS
jgi:hypothetical protein